MNYEKETSQYWDNVHIVVDNAILPGNDLAGHLSQLNVSLPLSGTVLCIGVGVCGWVKELHALGYNVWALDISSVALGKVSSFAACISNLQSLPDDTFDLAMSLWVAPHMRDIDLAEQLKCVVRSLTSSGVLAIHYNELLEGCAANNHEGQVAESPTAQAGSMLRTRETFMQMVHDAGGVAVIVDDKAEYPAYSMRAVMAHVRKIIP